jgi:transcriptional regulator with XRE-family HTH domain
MSPRQRDPASPRTRIEKRRQLLGLSQSAVAENAGISLRTLQRIEHGDMDNPPIRYLAGIAQALGLPLDGVIEPEWRQPPDRRE